MGFWSSFLGHAAANAINEAQKETKKHNDMCYQLSDYMDELNKYLERIGCKQVYIADYGCIDTGSISIEKRKMDTIRRKVEEYKNLGGNPAYIQDLDELDEHIEIIKYLKSVNRLDRQKEFLGLDLEFVKDDIEREIKEETSVLSLINVQGNILNMVVAKRDDSFISYDNWEESANIIKIDTAKYYSENTVQFLEYKTISLIFTETNIYVYSYELDDHSQLYCNIPIGKNQKLNITSLPIPAVEGWSMVVIDDLQILCANNEAEKVVELYRKHNADIYLAEDMLQQTVVENINELSGVEFERVCQQLVESMGFETETTKASGDGGIDLIAYNYQPLLSGKYIIQCKRYSGSVGEPIIRDLYGVITSERANKGILMTTGTFTKSAISFADGKPIELIDGEKLHDLLDAYGIMRFDSNIEETDDRTAKDVFLNNALLDFEYERYANTISELDITNDEQKRAEFINWLMYLTLSMVPDIDDFQEKLIIFKEIKNQIKKYLCQDRVEKSKWLPYLYQATYVQLSILEGDFCDAKEAFEKLMENKELQIPLEVTTDLFPEDGKYFMYDHTGIFTALCYTWYDMVQVAIIMDDDLYKSYLIGDDKFYGYPSMEKGRLRSTVEDFDSGRRTEGNRNYFSEKLNEFEEIEILVYENAPLRRLYIMSNYELDLYYKYTYEDEGEAADLTPNDYKVALEGNALKIEEIGEIKNIKKKIQKWKL